MVSEAHAELNPKGHLGRQPFAHLAAGQPAKNPSRICRYFGNGMVVACGPGDPRFLPFSSHAVPSTNICSRLRAPV